MATAAQTLTLNAAASCCCSDFFFALDTASFASLSRALEIYSQTTAQFGLNSVYNWDSVSVSVSASLSFSMSLLVLVSALVSDLS